MSDLLELANDQCLESKEVCFAVGLASRRGTAGAGQARTWLELSFSSF